MLKSYKGTDTKAPRYRKKTNGIINRKLYKKFITKYPSYKEHGYSKFREVVDLFHLALRNEVLEYRDGIELPESIGNIFLASCKAPKKINIDHNKSLKYKTAVIHNNYDTDGRIGKLIYTNIHNKYRFANREVWAFTADRNFKRACSKAYKQDFKKYIEIDPNIKINSLYKKSKQRDFARNKAKQTIHLYNPFDID